jgi:hypothetical protein
MAPDGLPCGNGGLIPPFQFSPQALNFLAQGGIVFNPHVCKLDGEGIFTGLILQSKGLPPQALGLSLAPGGVCLCLALLSPHTLKFPLQGGGVLGSLLYLPGQVSGRGRGAVPIFQGPALRGALALESCNDGGGLFALLG